MKVTLLAFAFVLALAGVAHAHKDRVFALEADGRISGLDEWFEPASIAGVTGEGGLEMVVTLSGHSVTLPPCIANFFVGPSVRDLSLSGSWWHEPGQLPPYLSIRPVGNDWPHSLLLDLQSGALLEFSDGSPDALERLCSRDELASLIRYKPPTAVFDSDLDFGWLVGALVGLGIAVGFGRERGDLES